MAAEKDVTQSRAGLMKPGSFRRIFIISGLMILVIIYAVLWLQMIADPVQRTGSDFIAFYAAGRVAQEYGTSRVYDVSLEQAVQQQVVGFDLVPGQVLLYNHVPFLVPILMALVNGNYVASFIRWVLVLLVVFIAGITILTRFLRGEAWERADVWIAGAGLVAFYPLFTSLTNGQDSAFTFFGLCLWAAGLLTGRDWLAGFGLALTSVRPQITFFLAVPFLFHRQKVFAWFCLGFAILGLLSLAIIGPAGARGFLDLLLVSAGGTWFGLHEDAMVDLVGLLWRFLPFLGGDAIRWIGWAAYALALVGLCAVWRRARTLDEKHIGLAVVLAVFASPHLHYHDLALLLVPLALVMVFLVRRGYMQARHASLIPLVSSLALLLGSLVPALKYNLPVFLMAMLVLFLWIPQKIFWTKKRITKKRIVEAS